MLGDIPDWQELIGFLPDGLNNNLLTRSAVASTFVASLELAKEGYIELKQNNTYGNAAWFINKFTGSYLNKLTDKNIDDISTKISDIIEKINNSVIICPEKR